MAVCIALAATAAQIGAIAVGCGAPDIVTVGPFKGYGGRPVFAVFAMHGKAEMVVERSRLALWWNGPSA